MQLGRQEGRREALQSLLQLKFGELPQWAQQQIEQASEEQLNQWMAAILTADSLETMLGQH